MRFERSEVTDVIFSGGTPSTKIKEYWNGGIPWLSSGETRNNFIVETEKTITEQGARNSSARLARVHDVIVASAGQGNTRGQVSFCLIDTYINQSIIALRAKYPIMDPRFLYYNLKSRYQELRRISDSFSSRGSLTTKLLADLEMPVPPLEQQKKNSEILYLLDMKILGIRKQNHNLKNIVWSIFKSWFVDYDGQTELVDSELGEIPKRWRIKKFSEVAEILGGGTPKTDIPQFWNGDVKWISLVDTEQEPYIIETEKMISRLGVAKSNAKLLPFETIVITARGTVGNCSMMGESMAINQSCYGLRGKENIGQIFLFHLLKSKLMSFLTNVHGTVFDTITRSTFDTVEVVIPEPQLINKFENLSRPLFSKILINLNAIRTLSRIRDTLLPKLLSAEITA